MRARVVYIFRNGEDSEAENGAEGLVHRLSTRCGQIFCSNLKNGNVTKTQGKPEKELKVKVGAYLLFHANSPTGVMGMIAAEALCKTMLVVMGDNFKELEKVVFLACAIAPKTKDFDNGAHDPGKAIGYLMTFLLCLKDEGVYPRIAGYDNFVSLVPLQASEKNPILTDTGNRDNELLDTEDYKVHAGRKVGRNKSNEWGLARPKVGDKKSYSEAHKRVFYFKDGMIHVADGGGWSDL